MIRNYLSILAVTLLLAGMLVAYPAIAQQSKSEGVKYNCPYLHDEARRTLSEITQGKDGWFLRAGEITEYFALLPHTKNYLERLTKAFASQGSDLLLLQVPPRTFSAAKYLDPNGYKQGTFNLEDGISYYNAYMDSLKSTGASVVHMLDKMDDVEKGTGLHFFFKRDPHWTPFGAKLAAQKVADVLKKNKKYQQITPSTYKTEKISTSQMKENFAMEIVNLCTDEIPAEPYQLYQTNIQLGKGEDALFGDSSSAAPLVLLGSSFSALRRFNFDGFLSEYTGLDVANFAISAGQLFNSIVSYTSLPKAERLNPDFVLWENLAHYDFNFGDTMFRQAIPAVYGECSAKDAIKIAKINTAGGKKSIKIFDIPSDKKVSGSDYYLFLKTNNMGLSNFTLEMEYSDGDGEWFIIDRREHFNNSGRFFVELSDEIDSSLNKINLIGFPSIKADIEIRLCHI